MNINKLKKGQEFKNYKKLCEWLGIEPVGGKSKILQFKDLERYFSFNKQGNKIIIDEIYDTPKEKIDNRKNNKGHGSFCYILKDNLFSLIHETYNEGYKGYYRVNELMSPYGFNLVPNEEYIKKEINDFYANIYKRKFEDEFIYKLKTACKSLEKDYNFKWRYTYLLDNNIIADEKTYNTIIKIFSKARWETCNYFGYASRNFDILMAKEETAPAYYNNYIRERLREAGLNHDKRQKIFIFEWNDDISILESKNNFNHENSFEDYIEKQGILFDLFKNRMNVVTEKLIILYSKIRIKEDVIINFNDVHNDFWDWTNDLEYSYLKPCN